MATAGATRCRHSKRIRAYAPFFPLEREALPVLFDMLNLLDAVDFLQDPPDGVTNVAEAPSLQVYWANRNRAFAV